MEQLTRALHLRMTQVDQYKLQDKVKKATVGRKQALPLEVKQGHFETKSSRVLSSLKAVKLERLCRLQQKVDKDKHKLNKTHPVMDGKCGRRMRYHDRFSLPCMATLKHFEVAKSKPHK